MPEDKTTVPEGFMDTWAARGPIRPNKLRDLHAALSEAKDDAEYRATVELWLKDVTYAE